MRTTGSAPSRHVLYQKDWVYDPSRPQIGWLVSSCVALCRAGTSFGPAGHDMARTVIDAIGAMTKGWPPAVALRDVTIRAAVQLVGEHAEWMQRTGDQIDAARGVAAAAAVADGSVRGSLAAAWDMAAQPESLDAVITAGVAEGWDAEGLTWAVIGFEAQQHTNLIWHVSNRMAPNFPGRTASDLFGWGWQGLRAALRKYDPRRGFKFSTYACRRIAGSIQDGVRSENPIPKRLTTFVRKVASAEEALAAELGRVATLEEVAGRLVETETVVDASDDGAFGRLVTKKLGELSIMPRLSQAASIEEMSWLAAERGTEVPVLTVHDDPADEAVEAQRRAAIEDAFALLDPDDAEAARLLLYEGVSVAEARARTGATGPQLRRRCERARERLAVSLRQWDS